MRRLFAVLLSFFLCLPSWAVGFSAPTANQHCSNSVSGVSSFSCTNGAAPTAGNVVFVGILTFVGLTLSTVQDQSGNNLTVHGCSSANDGSAGSSCLASYIAPSGVAGGQFTVTVTGGTCAACDIIVNEFGVSGGTASFDKKDTTGNGIGAINSPTLSPAGSGELFFVHASPAVTVTAVNGLWTLGPDGILGNGDATEYQLSVGVATAVGFDGIGGTTWDAVIGAYSFTPSGGGSSSGNISQVIIVE